MLQNYLQNSNESRIHNQENSAVMFAYLYEARRK